VDVKVWRTKVGKHGNNQKATSSPAGCFLWQVIAGDLIIDQPSSQFGSHGSYPTNFEPQAPLGAEKRMEKRQIDAQKTDKRARLGPGRRTLSQVWHFPCNGMTPEGQDPSKTGKVGPVLRVVRVVARDPSRHDVVCVVQCAEKRTSDCARVEGTPLPYIRKLACLTPLTTFLHLWSPLVTNSVYF
jgi:hypothetical protein